MYKQTYMVCVDVSSKVPVKLVSSIFDTEESIMNAISKYVN